jgi:Tol biopolymer transport system component
LSASISGPPAWAPDGQRFAAHCYGPDSEHLESFCILNKDGQMEDLFSTTQVGVGSFGETISWASDGNRLAFSGYSADTGSSDIYLYDRTTKLIVTLFSEPGYFKDSPVWVP